MGPPPHLGGLLPCEQVENEGTGLDLGWVPLSLTPGFSSSPGNYTKHPYHTCQQRAVDSSPLPLYQATSTMSTVPPYLSHLSLEFKYTPHPINFPIRS